MQKGNNTGAPTMPEKSAAKSTEKKAPAKPVSKVSAVGKKVITAQPIPGALDLKVHKYAFEFPKKFEPVFVPQFWGGYTGGSTSTTTDVLDLKLKFSKIDRVAIDALSMVKRRFKNVPSEGDAN